MQILGVLWRNGPGTVREVLNSLPDGKQRAYTSVLSVMQVMEKKGLLSRKREGLTDRWRPAVRKSKILGSFLHGVVQRIFGGRPTDVMQHLLEDTEVDEKELQEIRALLDNYEQSRLKKRS